MIGCTCSLCTIRSFAGFVIGELSAFVTFYYPSAGTEPSSPRNRAWKLGRLFISMAASPSFQFSERNPCCRFYSDAGSVLPCLGPYLAFHRLRPHAGERGRGAGHEAHYK